MKKSIILFLILIATPAFADKYIVFVDKNSEASAANNGNKTSFEQGDVIAATPLPKGCEDLSKCLSPNEIQNNIIIVMDLTTEQLSAMMESKVVETVTDGNIGRLMTSERKKKFDVETILGKNLTEEQNVQETLDSMSVKPSVVDVITVEE